MQSVKSKRHIGSAPSPPPLGCPLRGVSRLGVLGAAPGAAARSPAPPGRAEEEDEVAYGYHLLELAAQKRGMRVSGGDLDTERMARVLLDEFRGGKLGRITLERPPEQGSDGQ